MLPLTHFSSAPMGDLILQCGDPQRNESVKYVVVRPKCNFFAGATASAAASLTPVGTHVGLGDGWRFR